jgi:quinol monooxygenase YgiN
MTLVISGEIHIDPADFDRAMALVGPFVATTRAEDGCVAYDFWVDPTERGRIRLFEEWASAETNAAHTASQHLADFYAAMAALRVTSVELVRYEVSARVPL